MKRIIQTLFPSADIVPNSSLYSNTSLVCIHIDNESFYLELNYQTLPDNLETSLSQILASITKSKNITVFIKHHTPLDHLTKHKISYHLQFKNYLFYLFISIDFLTYLAKYLHLINISYTSSTIRDLQKELFRYQPSLLPKEIWNTLDKKELSNLFNSMLSEKLVSTQMLSIFFKHLEFPSPQNYFSQRIASEIQNELHELDMLSTSISETITYVIERNILLLFRENRNISSLMPFFINYRNQFQNFIQTSAKKFSLKSLIFIEKYHNRPEFYQFINSIPYQELIAFLKMSPQENIYIIEKSFSKEGQYRLKQDIEEMPIISCHNVFKKLALFEVQCNLQSCSSYIEKYITSERNWEFLAREIPLSELIIILDQLDQVEKKKLSQLINHLYFFHKEKKIKFPQPNRQLPISKILTYTSSQIEFLKLINLL